MPVLDHMLQQQNESGKIWTPSAMINHMGNKIANEESVYYWAAKNNIPVGHLWHVPAPHRSNISNSRFDFSKKNFNQEKKSKIIKKNI